MLYKDFFRFDLSIDAVRMAFQKNGFASVRL